VPGGDVVKYDQVQPGTTEYIAIHDFDAENGLEGPQFEEAQNKPWRQRILQHVVRRDHRRFKHIREFSASDYKEPE
jgi:polyribonucleotide nucleotidyltransferase